MHFLQEVVDYLNTHPEDLVALSGLVSVVVQYALNRVRALSKLHNALLGLVAIPGITGVGVAYFTSLHLTVIPAVAVLGQLIYHTWESLKRNAVLKATAQASTVSAPTNEPTIAPF